MSQPNIQNTSYLHYLEGGGEMGRLTREFDWSKTILGTPGHLVAKFVNYC